MNFIMQNGGSISDLSFLQRFPVKFVYAKAAFYEKRDII